MNAFADNKGKYLNSDTEYQWKRLQKCADDFGNIRIANTGLVSSGKSTLYNALIGAVDHEEFATGAARKTLAEQDREYFSGTTLVDTPGIDVKIEDDARAFDAIAVSDIIIMVHNVKIGELQREECEWLEKIAAITGEAAEHRVIVVLSWIDERDSDAEYDNTVNKIKSMVQNIFNPRIKVLHLSAKRYINGVKSGKEKLIECSNVNKLSDTIKAMAGDYTKLKRSEFMDNLDRTINDTRIQLNMAKNRRVVSKREITERIKKEYKSIFSLLNSHMANLRDKVSAYRRLVSEYRNL